MTRSAGGYLRFLAWAVAVAAAVALLGWLPTRWLGGDGAVRAMLAGCAVSVVASAAGAVPIALSRGAAPAVRMKALLMAMGLRFGVVVILALAAVLSGLFDRAPLLIWVAVSYAAQLVVETRYALAKDDVETR
ncbi:MAG TPA: hypothetical protein VH394_30520 [Thermoanaerobaculia bacterium]|nr:hypothetical protein [Thermoanaerobaculia bacterium]